jgi:hypothetical protein
VVGEERAPSEVGIKRINRVEIADARAAGLSWAPIPTPALPTAVPPPVDIVHCLDDHLPREIFHITRAGEQTHRCAHLLRARGTGDDEVSRILMRTIVVRIFPRFRLHLMHALKRSFDETQHCTRTWQFVLPPEQTIRHTTSHLIMRLDVSLWVPHSSLFFQLGFLTLDRLPKPVLFVRTLQRL